MVTFILHHLGGLHKFWDRPDFRSPALAFCFTIIYIGYASTTPPIRPLLPDTTSSAPPRIPILI